MERAKPARERAYGGMRKRGDSSPAGLKDDRRNNESNTHAGTSFVKGSPKLPRYFFVCGKNKDKEVKMSSFLSSPNGPMWLVVVPDFNLKLIALTF